MKLAHGFARWLRASLANLPRPRALFGGGPRGGGKTWFLGGLAIVAVALAFPGEWQFGINLTSKQRRECLASIHAAARPEWIAADSDDFRDPRTEFITGSIVQWLSGRAPGAIRQAGLRLRVVFINEGQDQPEKVFINGIAAIRNTGGLLSVATNPPSQQSGDWVAIVWQKIDAGELNGELFDVPNTTNRAIDQEAQSDIGAFIRAVNRGAASADIDGIFKLSGPIAYPAFSSLPRERGGHVGVVPAIGWRDVTRKLSAEAVGGQVGYDYVVGVDFQRRPGIIGSVCKLYLDDRDKLVLVVKHVVCVNGVEADFSQALVLAGYSPAGVGLETGKPAPSVLLIGDATGARQNAEHKFQRPPSFVALKADGWTILPPMHHWRHHTPWNPPVRDSRAQMHGVLEQRQFLIEHAATEGTVGSGFPSPIESFRNAKVTPKGELVEKGDYQHFPDGVRYLAWRFLPRAKPPSLPYDASTADEIRKLRIFTSS